MSSWQSIDKCKSCGSSNIDKSHELKRWECIDCGAYGDEESFFE